MTGKEFLLCVHCDLDLGRMALGQGQMQFVRYCSMESRR